MGHLILAPVVRSTRRLGPVSWSRRGSRWRDIALLFPAVLLSGTVHAQTNAISIEYQVKAAYLLNFTRYVEWPAASFSSADAPLNICVFGQDPFGEELDRATANRSSQGHPIRVRRARNRSELDGCHLVYVGADESRRLTESPGKLIAGSVLTVGDTEQFARDGGVIGFLIDNETVRFVVNLDARDRAGVKISSRVLTLAFDLISASGDRF